MRNVQVSELRIKLGVKGSGLRQEQIKAANIYLSTMLGPTPVRSRNAANLLSYQGESYHCVIGVAFSRDIAPTDVRQPNEQL